MIQRRLEVLAASIARMNGALDPKSDAFRLNNPGGLLAFNPKHERDEKGRRIFKHFAAGWDNLCLDVLIKCSGKSRAKLTPESKLIELLHVYGNPSSSIKYVINFLRHGLNDNNIPESIHLGWFIEEQSEDPQS